MISDGYDSPAGVDTPLDYISVEDYKWPTPSPVKRSRLDEKERRRRHCECQKRFLARKQREFEQLHEQVARLELQLKLVEATRETHELQLEHSQLTLKQTILEGAIPSDTAPLDSIVVKEHEEESRDHDRIVGSLDVDDILAELGLPSW